MQAQRKQPSQQRSKLTTSREGCWDAKVSTRRIKPLGGVILTADNLYIVNTKGIKPVPTGDPPEPESTHGPVTGAQAPAPADGRGTLG